MRLESATTEMWGTPGEPKDARQIRDQESPSSAFVVPGHKIFAGQNAGHNHLVSVQLNHTIVSCRDQRRSAAFLTGILGLPTATRFAHFLVVEADNGVSLDFAETTATITPQHYAFLVGEDDFDAAFGRIRDQDLPYWADPGQSRPGVINHRDGGRGLYFEDPDGHLLEIITRPYGSGS